MSDCSRKSSLKKICTILISSVLFLNSTFTLKLIYNVVTSKKSIKSYIRPSFKKQNTFYHFLVSSRKIIKNEKKLAGRGNRCIIIKNTL